MAGLHSAECWLIIQPTFFAFSLLGRVYICHVCTQCVCVTKCKVRAILPCVCVTELCTSHCALGKAIGRRRGVIKVKLLPPPGCLCLLGGTIEGEALLLSCFTPALPSSLPFFLTAFTQFLLFTLLKRDFWQRRDRRVCLQNIFNIP